MAGTTEGRGVSCSKLKAETETEAGGGDEVEAFISPISDALNASVSSARKDNMSNE